MGSPAKKEGQLVDSQPLRANRFSPQCLTRRSLLVNRTIERVLKTVFGGSSRASTAGTINPTRPWPELQGAGCRATDGSLIVYLGPASKTTD